MPATTAGGEANRSLRNVALNASSEASPVFEIGVARAQRNLRQLPFARWMFPDGSAWLEFYRCDSGYLLRFPNLADFELTSAGAHVACFPATDVDDATAEHLYRNQVLPLALGRGGNLVFHASAVETPAGALAFVAASGLGKSTLAAAFATRGFGFLSDDALRLVRVGEAYHVIPSHPDLRLWDDSRLALLGPDAARSPPLGFTSKSRFPAGGELAYCNRPVMLKAVYFLADCGADEIAIAPLNGAEALIDWTRHGFFLDIEDKQAIHAHFEQTVALANHVSCYRLNYPRRYDALPNVIEAILAHADCVRSKA